MVKFYAQAFQSIRMHSKPEQIASRAAPLYATIAMRIAMAQMCEFAMNLSNKEFAKVFSYQHFGGCVNSPKYYPPN